jgi:hypothetical protein
MNLANDLKGTRDRILIAMEGSLVHVAVRDLRPGSAAGVISVGAVRGWDQRNARLKVLAVMPRRGGM